MKIIWFISAIVGNLLPTLFLATFGLIISATKIGPFNSPVWVTLVIFWLHAFFGFLNGSIIGYFFIKYNLILVICSFITTFLLFSLCWLYGMGVFVEYPMPLIHFIIFIISWISLIYWGLKYGKSREWRRVKP